MTQSKGKASRRWLITALQAGWLVASALIGGTALLAAVYAEIANLEIEEWIQVSMPLRRSLGMA